MTNWMTAAGLAFIAGGLATLISFRAVLFGGGARRATRAGTPARRRRSRDVAPAPVTLESEPARPAAADRPRRRRRLAAAFSGPPADTDAGHGALASIGLADDEPDGPVEDEREHAEPAEPHPEPELVPQAADEYEEPEPRPVVDRSDRAYGDRIDDWVRPQYPDLDDRAPAGEYWTPVPDDLYTDPEPSARGYGWPVPVERLPPVPDYEPATGFDLSPVAASEPTALVPTWPPASEDRRIRLPRSWASRNEKPAGPGEKWASRNEKPAGPGEKWASRNEKPAGPGEKWAVGDGDWAGPGEPAGAGPRHGRGDRARPRPRPRRSTQGEAGYVSRHAAGPHS